jgi:hypothetical protein
VIPESLGTFPAPMLGLLMPLVVKFQKSLMKKEEACGGLGDES